MLSGHWPLFLCSQSSVFSTLSRTSRVSLSLPGVGRRRPEMGQGGWALPGGEASEAGFWGSPYPPHTASSSPLNTSLCPCSQGRFCCYAHFQAPPDSCPHCALHVCALSSHVPLSPAKPRPHFVYLFLQKALPGWLTSTLLESSLACIGFWFVLYSVLCKCSSFLKTSCQPLLLSGSSLRTSTPSLSTAPITIQL